MGKWEELRFLHENIERLEQGESRLVSRVPTVALTYSTPLTAIAERLTEEPKHIRARLVRDHEIANFLNMIHNHSQRALEIYREKDELMQEVQIISTGDTAGEFNKQFAEIKEWHRKYPNERVENLEKAYKKLEDAPAVFAGDIDAMFTGEEAYGRYWDLTTLHEEYLNLPGIRGVKKVSYLQYLDLFDKFTPPACPMSKQDKLTDEYFSYITSLAEYLEGFMRRTKPLEDLDSLFKTFSEEFEQLCKENKVPGWGPPESKQTNGTGAPKAEGTGAGVWCADCAKEFKNDNVYKAHLTGKKHIKNAEARKEQMDVDLAPADAFGNRLKERAVAEREHRVRKLAGTMQTAREDTRVNVERKQGMTDRERQQELAALLAEDHAIAGISNGGEAEEADGDEKVYNPLKLPLAWDGNPIPFWLYKLHGLGVEFPCEICGNFVYMGRRAFEKHFSEARHVYGLKCLGITNTSLFREITRIKEAEKLWAKLQRDKELEREKYPDKEEMMEMEDSQGNLMPYKVWKDLEKAGML
jgi:splicing factor 3A subunit 3